MITLDVETKSEADLLKVGAWNYSKHPTTEMICLAWTHCDMDEIFSWVPGELIDPDLVTLIEDGEPVEAHNVSFEQAMWDNVLVPRHGFPPIKPEQWRDSMAVACYYALPASLDKLTMALGGEGKDPKGARLISKYSKLHLKTAKKEIPPEDLQAFIDYCKDDVALEAGISRFLGELPERELKLFHLDRAMNMRGLHLDVNGIHSARKVVSERWQDYATRFRELTGLSPNQVKQVREWLGDKHGIHLPNLQKETIQDILKTDIAMGDAREVLKLRLSLAKASTRKLDAMLNHVDMDDHRARNQTRYHGTTTGRNTGSGFQPLNLVRNDESMDPDLLMDAIAKEDAAYLDLLFGDAMTAISKASRHNITAEQAKKLLAADFVSIEAIVLACLAGEQWKVEAFARGDKIYEQAADKIYKLPLGTVTKYTHPDERQDGKIAELAFGYQGGVGAWRGFDSSDRHSDEAVDAIKKAWRKEHPMIVKLWEEYETCAIAAVTNPGNQFSYRGIDFQMERDHWLAITLLNGKKIWYFQPELRRRRPPWHKPTEKEACKAGECDCGYRQALTLMSMKNGQWRRIDTYGGKLVENVTQAVAREILKDKELLLDEAGLPTVLTVYDEIVIELPEEKDRMKQFMEIMGRREGFYKDWPIMADAWEGKRYRK